MKLDSLKVTFTDEQIDEILVEDAIEKLKIFHGIDVSSLETLVQYDEQGNATVEFKNH